ncbi:RagB/SusD domain-containing protein [Mucilaginibacter gracilis]|uniref:RagB/SusD domain-containing protein n=1 Tax=Mucilaginibacter gracilis TaxID=423350 RepID=A0A495IVF2_9SPHI|nr:RagB/SusD family nutrient uptake outer membrane protein [Mucilaginibacter gracilis]RKR79994.1 RagB/SusD domain-containing protein [Mucilaginibacter gracilis]
MKIILKYSNVHFWLGLIVLTLGFSACKKLVSIPAPVNSITTAETFSTEANATSVLAGIYDHMINTSRNAGIATYASGEITLLAGLSADELIAPGQGYDDFVNNQLLPDNPLIDGNLWAPAYSDIYKANAIIEGVTASTALTPAVKNQLIGEAKFVRAFVNFYLVNLFGDIPLVTTTAWQQTANLKRTTSALVYQQIITDLKDAESLLPIDYSVSGGKRIRPNALCASALLARVYLYTGDYPNAEIEASKVIGNSAYSLPGDLNSVFLRGSKEAIWQLQVNDNYYPYCTPEGNSFIPTDPTNPPVYYLTPQLIVAFEPNDQRKSAWLQVLNISGTDFYYPYKYKIQQGPATGTPEDYMVLRLGEQYLIRGEARIRQNKIADGISDLNALRNRAGLAALSNTLTQSAAINAVLQERRVELVCEWGHRWLDLKRTKTVDAILSATKPTWKSYQALYPIPANELILNNNLTQSSGY